MMRIQAVHKALVLGLLGACVVEDSGPRYGYQFDSPDARGQARVFEGDWTSEASFAFLRFRLEPNVYMEVVYEATGQPGCWLRAHSVDYEIRRQEACELESPWQCLKLSFAPLFVVAMVAPPSAACQAAADKVLKTDAVTMSLTYQSGGCLNLQGRCLLVDD